MNTEEFVIGLFCRVDAGMGAEPKHLQAKFVPERVRHRGVALRAEWGRWPRGLPLPLRSLFPALPERTRLVRLLAAHREWADRFLAEPTLLGIVYSYGIGLRHPVLARFSL